MTDRELFKMALDALNMWELMQPQTTSCAIRIPAIEALRARLAQPKREWVGLTDEEINALHYELKCAAMGATNTLGMYRILEQALKDKNNG